MACPFDCGAIDSTHRRLTFGFGFNKNEERLIILNIENLPTINFDLDFEETLQILQLISREITTATSSFLRWFRFSENAFIGMVKKRRLSEHNKETLAALIKDMNNKLFPCKKGSPIKLEIYGLFKW